MPAAAAVLLYRGGQYAAQHTAQVQPTHGRQREAQVGTVWKQNRGWIFFLSVFRMFATAPSLITFDKIRMKRSQILTFVLKRTNPDPT